MVQRLCAVMVDIPTKINQILKIKNADNILRTNSAPAARPCGGGEGGQEERAGGGQRGQGHF